MKSVLHAIATFTVITVAVLLVMGQLAKLDNEIQRIIDRPASTAER
ncbi:hypothetical protein [Nocardioides mangrovi]|uniref:Uncharacterized protein n=1 Tax=Nocardioides mangrovi TaxID=2874580 RepID=A0ABS7UD49_9ACTN|nr:hypothetical protein [Nocardioides mangrovi]MBZ5738925.1 hypothetical protein [Nocardioides mangrovi]